MPNEKKVFVFNIGNIDVKKLKGWGKEINTEPLEKKKKKASWVKLIEDKMIKEEINMKLEIKGTKISVPVEGTKMGIKTETRQRDTRSIKKVKKEGKLLEDRDGKEEEDYRIHLTDVIIHHDEVAEARATLNSKLRELLRMRRDDASGAELVKIKNEVKEAKKSLYFLKDQLYKTKKEAIDYDGKYFKYLKIPLKYLR